MGGTEGMLIISHLDKVPYLNSVQMVNLSICPLWGVITHTAYRLPSSPRLDLPFPAVKLFLAGLSSSTSARLDLLFWMRNFSFVLPLSSTILNGSLSVDSRILCHRTIERPMLLPLWPLLQLMMKAYVNTTNEKKNQQHLIAADSEAKESPTLSNERL